LKLRERCGGVETDPGTGRITFIFVTYDQEEALILSDRVVVMENGKIIQMGSPREVYERPQTEFVARFIGQSNIMSGVVQQSASNELEFVTEKGLRLPLPQDGHISIGERVAMQIRAERIHVSPLGQAVEQKLKYTGIIERVIYAGNAVHLYIRVENGETILSIRPTTGELPLPQYTRVMLGFDPKDFVVLRGEP
jgi:ABC-type Fe3+/spermidine/putrescine transport system ATPase subunit